MSETFLAAHADYAQAWNLALRTGDTRQVESRMASGYHGWFATSGRDVHPYDRDTAVAGMNDSIDRLKGAEVVFSCPVFSSRSPSESLVFYQKEIRQNGKLVSRAMIHEAWTLLDGHWVIEREFTEHGAVVEA